MKRGFGAVQMVSILVIAVAAIILVIWSFISGAFNAVEKTKIDDISNVYAEIVLDNLLALPINEPPKGLYALSTRPTISDFLSYSEDSKLVEEQLVGVLTQIVINSDRIFTARLSKAGESLANTDKFYPNCEPNPVYFSGAEKTILTKEGDLIIQLSFHEIDCSMESFERFPTPPKGGFQS